jgi:hypothetical protein
MWDADNYLSRWISLHSFCVPCYRPIMMVNFDFQIIFLKSIGKITGKQGKGQSILEIPVATDDFQMKELGKAFGVEVLRLLDLLEIMHKCKEIELSDIKKEPI